MTSPVTQIVPGEPWTDAQVAEFQEAWDAQGWPRELVVPRTSPPQLQWQRGVVANDDPA